MEFFTIYLRQRKTEILRFLLFCSIFLLSFFLYELPIKAVLYPILLCAVIAFTFFLRDIRAEKKKHQILSEIARFPGVLTDQFPEADTQDDMDYQKIIQLLQQEQKQTQDQLTHRYQNMMEYYTIWVHQIKTPIAAMRLILQNEDSALSRQLSEELLRIEQYVEMVLAYLRLDSEAKDYVFQEQELDLIIRDALKKFAGQFIRKKLQLNYKPICKKVLTDEKWLSFVVEQVLSNALKYTYKGEISIIVEEPLTLCIQDTGIGIAKEDLPRVFEKSYTGYNGRNDKKASGIGLYLCKRICDNLGHSISIDSSPNVGTTVKIELQHRKMKLE